MRRLSVLTLALALAALPAAAGAATFSDPFPLSAVATVVQGPVTAVAPTGAAVIAYTRVDELGVGRTEVALRPAGGTFGSPKLLNDLTKVSGDALVAMDPAGDATVVWQETVGSQGHTTIRTVTAPAGQDFGAAQTLSDTTKFARSASFGMDSTGDALVVWVYAVGGTVSASRTGLGQFGAAAALTPDSVEGTGVALNARGDATAAYTHAESSTTTRIMVARRSGAGGALTTPAPVSPDGVRAGVLDVGIDDAGNAIIGYQASGAVVHSLPVSAAGTAGPDQSLTAAKSNSPVNVAVDGAGDAALPYLTAAGEAVVATAAPGQPFGTPTTLDPAAAGGVAVGGDAAGDLLLAWPHTTGSGTILRYAERDGAAGALATPADVPGSLPAFAAAAIAAPDRAVLAFNDKTDDKAQVKASSTGAGTATTTPTPTGTATPTSTPAPSVTPTRTPTPAASVPSAAALKATLARAGRQKRGRVAKRGRLKVRCTLSQAGTCVVSVRLGKRVVARGKATLTTAGTRTVTAKLTKKGRRLLRKRRRVTLTITAAARAGTVTAKAPPLKLKLR